MTVEDTHESDNYKKVFRRQADKLSTYSIAVRESACSLADLEAVSRLLGVELDKEKISARLTVFENICHLLSHLSLADLRYSERKAFSDYAQIAVLLDRQMLAFAARLKYEEGRQNSRNWIEEHQHRPDYSGDLPRMAATLERELSSETAA